MIFYRFVPFSSQKGVLFFETPGIWKEVVSNLWKVTVLGDISAEQNECNKHCFIN